MQPIYAELRHTGFRATKFQMKPTDFKLDPRVPGPVQLSESGLKRRRKAILEYVESKYAVKVYAKDVEFHVELSTEQQEEIIRATVHQQEYRHVLERRASLTRRILEHEEHIRKMRQDLKDDQDVDDFLAVEIPKLVQGPASFRAMGLQ